MKDEVNVNLSSCLVERTNIGSYEYINICTGETNKINWDLKDWTSLGLIIMFIILIIVMAGILIKEFIER
nr:MAG TPA: hypothetical protein [Caudoviricetes sp.]